MGFVKEINKDFYIKDNRIYLSDDYLIKNKSRFKKITGSRLASILDKNKYTSPLKTWAIMVGIFVEDMDPLYAEAGNIIEPKIKSYVENQINLKYISYNPKNIGFDIFKENKIFGGIPDGEPIDELGNLSYPTKPMLEIKTTSIDSFVFEKQNGLLRVKKDSDGIPIVKEVFGKKKQWFINENIQIPLEYKYQLGLYCYLRKTQKGIFAISFLEKEDYANPNNFIPTKNNTFIHNINIDIKNFEKVINFATNWYFEFIESGISPEIKNEDWLWIRG